MLRKDPQLLRLAMYMYLANYKTVLEKKLVKFKINFETTDHASVLEQC